MKHLILAILLTINLSMTYHTMIINSPDYTICKNGKLYYVGPSVSKPKTIVDRETGKLVTCKVKS